MRILATNDVDLLLTDVIMPTMTGRELAEAALAMRSTLKVLYMSGYPDDDVLARGVNRGSVEIIEKPASRDMLAIKVRTVLDRGDRAQEAPCVS